MVRQLYRSTPVPDEVFDTHLKKLSLGELKVLLAIIRQTLGFRHPTNKAQFKAIDWISTNQFKQKTGCSNRTIAKAIAALTEQKLIQVTDAKGNVLETPQDRTGKSRLYYRQLLRQSNGKAYEHFAPTSEKNTLEPVQKVHTTTDKLTTNTSTTNDFDWNTFLDGLHESPYRPNNIIAYFFEKQGLRFSNAKQAQLAVDRHLPSAEKVQHFSDNQITQATNYLLSVFSRFTVETIYKHLTN